MRRSASALVAVVLAACTATLPAPSAAPSPTASPAVVVPWGIYLQATDPALGFIASNTKLVAITRTLQRTEVHNEIAWLFTGPWSPDGKAVLGGDRSGQSYVIWPDSLTTLPQTNWTWTDGDTLGGILPAANGQPELVRADAHTGRIMKRAAVTETNMGWLVGPSGEWISSYSGGPDVVGEAITATATQRVSSGPRTYPSGWLPDGRFVFVREAAASTVEVRDAARPDATVLARFGANTTALAQPTSSTIVALDFRVGRLWTIRGADVREVPLQATFSGQVMLESISRDGRTVSFSLVGGLSTRTGIVDLETGVVTYMCDAGCWRLVIN